MNKRREKEEKKNTLMHIHTHRDIYKERKI